MEDSIQNSFFYIFSTIAQVIGAFLALSVVFLILLIKKKDNLITKNIRRMLTQCAELITEFEPLGYSFKNEGMNKLILKDEYDLKDIAFIPSFVDQIKKSQDKGLKEVWAKKCDWNKIQTSQEWIVYSYDQAIDGKKMLKGIIRMAKASLVIGIITILSSIITIKYVPILNKLEIEIVFWLVFSGAICSLFFMSKLIWDYFSSLKK